jgi:High potential iron-sulfur protein
MLLLKLQQSRSMAQARKTWRENVSRRVVLDGIVSAIAGMPVILEATHPAWAAKMSKASAGYQNHPKGNQNCANCKLFVSPSSCLVVEGPISSNGWCRFWVAK